MDLFIQIITGYPVAVFSVMLIIAVFYWLIACLGIVDIDGLDADMDLDVPDGLDAGDAMDSGSVQGPLSGILLKFGLNGVPVTIVLSLIILFGWMLSYCGVLFTMNILETGFLRCLLDTGILLTSLIISTALPNRKSTVPNLRSSCREVTAA